LIIINLFIDHQFLDQYAYLFFIFSFQQGENTIKKFNPKNKHVATLLIKWNVEFLTLTSYKEKIDNAKIEKKT